MNLPEKIAACEIAYARQFCTEYEDENIIRFRHPEIKDIYSLNYTFIKKKNKELKARSLCEEEIAYSKAAREKYTNVVINASLHPRVLTYIKYPSIFTVNGFYVFDLKKITALTGVDGCIVQKVTALETLEEVLKIDIDVDGPTADPEFCTRRLYGKSRVYLSEGGVDAYICTHKGEIIGRCDLFIHEGVAKIEDFSIYEKHHRKGYGKTLLKHLIQIAIEKGCEMIYLVTDESDSAKEMYVKTGFDRLTETTEVRFILDKNTTS